MDARLDPGNVSLSLEVSHGEQHRFLYQVPMHGYFMPSFARADMGGLHLRNRRYFRAEVHLAEGSQDYDLIGYTKEQIIDGVLDQYGRHLQSLHLVCRTQEKGRVQGAPSLVLRP